MGTIATPSPTQITPSLEWGFGEMANFLVAHIQQLGLQFCCAASFVNGK